MAAVAAMALGVASGCTAETGLVAEGWSEPGWITLARQQMEEYELAMVSCLEEHGVRAEVSLGGHVGAFGHTHNDDGTEIPGAIDALLAASDACDSVERPEHWQLPQDESAYERMLDVRECLIAHGQEISEPPSMEVWIDQGPGQAWNPYRDLMPGWSANPLPDDELIALFAACPQSGHGFMSINRVE